MRERVNFRCYIEVNKIEEAAILSSSLIKLSGDLVDWKKVEIQKYWKIPEYYEIFIISNVVENNIREVIREIIDIYAKDWAFLGADDDDAIWDKKSVKSEFAIESVQWASISIHPEKEDE